MILVFGIKFGLVRSLALPSSEFGLVGSLALRYRLAMHRQDDQVGRRKPASGVHIYSGEPTIVFVTACSEKRVPWIAQPVVHELLKKVWTQASAWLVGNYQFMPDHLHLFAAPRDLKIPFNRWMSYWKRLFTQEAVKLTRQENGAVVETQGRGSSGRGSSGASPSRGAEDIVRNPMLWRWQSLHWDTRLRRSESYTEKWHYIRENPVKAGLVLNPEDWPYQGMLNVLRW